MPKGKSNTTVVISVVVGVILIAITAVVLFYFNADIVKTRTMVQINRDGKKIAEVSDAEYKYKLLNIMFQFEQSYGITDPTQAANFWLTPVEGVTQLDQIKNFALEQIKYEKVEYVKALENGIKLSSQEKDELKVSFSSIEKQFKDANQDIDDYLMSNYGISFNIYKDISEQSKIASKFSTLQISEIDVTEQELLDHYNENKAAFYSVKVRHILISTLDEKGNDLEGELLEEKKKLAEEILVKIESGEDMDALVDEYSEDPGAESNFGYYDLTENANFVPEFKEWAMNSALDDTGIVKTEFGYHIMKTYQVTNFEDIQLQVKRDLQTKRYSQTLSQWVEEYDIQVFDAVYESINPLA